MNSKEPTAFARSGPVAVGVRSVPERADIDHAVFQHNMLRPCDSGVRQTALRGPNTRQQFRQEDRLNDVVIGPAFSESIRSCKLPGALSTMIARS